jgi:hypoxanthine phosphoribosyltransferase
MTHPVGEQATTTGPATTAPPDDVRSAGAPADPAFAHASEAEMARILDFYAVTWEYEPHRFPILWNLDGSVVESFSPDFYLPDLDLYLEMTTLRQRLVRKKNRKLRRLRELYPNVRIKLFYARDFRALMLKYGKLALVGALSGASGQVGPILRVDPEVLDEVLSEPAILLDLSPSDSAALPVPVRPEPADAAPVPASPAASARPARRGRDENGRRPARRPARPERHGSGR